MKRSIRTQVLALSLCAVAATGCGTLTGGAVGAGAGAAVAAGTGKDVGKDEKKVTFVRLLGVPGAQALAAELLGFAVDSLAPLGRKADPLRELIPPYHSTRAERLERSTFCVWTTSPPCSTFTLSR